MQSGVLPSSKGGREAPTERGTFWQKGGIYKGKPQGENITFVFIGIYTPQLCLILYIIRDDFYDILSFLSLDGLNIHFVSERANILKCVKSYCDKFEKQSVIGFFSTISS